MVGEICNYVLGIRHLETQEKGLALMVSFVTLANCICIFALTNTLGSTYSEFVASALSA